MIDALETRQLAGVEIALVVNNRADAYGLQRALIHRLPAIYLPWNQLPKVATCVASRTLEPKATISESESRLAAVLQLFQVDLIVLAGWMRILSASFLEQFPQRVINI